MTEYRAEIIANQSVMDDITELLEKEIPDFEYTMITETHGKGLKTKKLGDTVWPEMNFILFAYVSLETAKKIKEVIADLCGRFPKEGISVFFTKCEEV